MWRKGKLKGSPAIFNDDGLVAVFEIEEERDSVIEMIDALIEARKAIFNASAESFGSATMEIDGKVIPYPLKDELLNKIDESLKKAGCHE